MKGGSIVPYETAYQPSVDELLLSISEEYEERIFSTGYSRLSDVYTLAGRQYWCAVAKGRVIGTVGIVLCGAGDYVLKSMFVHKDYRGKVRGIAQMLLQTAEQSAIDSGCKTMWLGTMAQFRAAQRFYERNGYSQIIPGEMPRCCPTNDVDTVFFSKKLYVALAGL